MLTVSISWSRILPRPRKWSIYARKTYRSICGTHTIGVVVRLRKELSLVTDVPMLIVVDQYNNWFTFNEYEEAVTVRSTQPIHAKELATAFRIMKHNDMTVGAFSHSTAVGKLRQDLPDVPFEARINFPRYTLDEAAAVCHYYLRLNMKEQITLRFEQRTTRFDVRKLQSDVPPINEDNYLMSTD